jgi:hypothetical protein
MRKYPYLGINQVDGKSYVVFFTEPDRGVIVLNETDSETLSFGKVDNFDESQFEFLSPDQCIRLQN